MEIVQSWGWGQMAWEAPSEVIGSDELSKCKTRVCRKTAVKSLLTQHSIFATIYRTVALERL